MKKILFLILTFVPLRSLLAQVEQGTIPLSGSLVFSQSRAENDNSANVFGLGLNAGYFLNDNFGIQAGFFSNHVKRKNRHPFFPDRFIEDKLTQNTYTLALRQYFNFLDFRLFGQNTFQYRSITRPTAAPPNDEENGFSSRLEFGANAFLSPNISIEGSAKFTWLRYESVKERTVLGRGPIEFLVEVRPFLIERGGEASHHAEEFLDAGGWNVSGLFYVHQSLENRDAAVPTNLYPNFLEISFLSKIGYFALPNLLVGANFGTSYNDRIISNAVGLNGGTFVRYYIRATDGLQVVPNAAVRYNYNKFRSDTGGSESKNGELTFALGIGLHTFIAEGVGLFGNGAIEMIRGGTNANAQDVNSLQFQAGLEFYLSGY